MRKFYLFSVGVISFQVFYLPSVHAQSVGTSVVQSQVPAALAPRVTPRVVRPSTAPQTASAATDVSPYERLRAALRPRKIETSTDLRAASTGTLVDRVIEIHGNVLGMVARNGRRTYNLQVDDISIALPAGPDFNNPTFMKPGASVRLLVQIDPNTDSRDGILSIMAATDEPEPDVSIVVATVSNQENTGPVVILPSEVLNLAPPPGTRRPPTVQTKIQPKTLPKTQPRAQTSSTSRYSTQAMIESQKPSYKALVKRHNKKLSEAQVDEIATAVLSAGYANNLDPRFLAAIIAVESDFDIYCVSSSGAMGLGQLMPFNLKEAGITNAWNPTQNVWGTARLLRGHLNDYRNRPDGTLLAVAAYNAGPGAVRRAGYRVPNGAQVQRYVWKVYYRYKEFAPDMFK